MDIQFLASDEELSNKFFNLSSLAAVADLLEVSTKSLSYILYVVPEKDKYNEFKIPKKSGGNRHISAPINALKTIQRKLNYVLMLVDRPKPSVHSFTNNRSILTNALAHSGQNLVFNIDLQDFFGSINFGRVRGLFLGKPFNLDESVATIFAQLCCFENRLPQGGPTSPILSNLVCKKLDGELQRLAKKYRCFYTRYADDISFSTSQRKLHKNIVFRNEIGELLVGEELQNIIDGNGFVVNRNKVWLYWRGRRQKVNGLTVNEFPNINKKYFSQVRAMLHSWEVNGHEQAEEIHYERFNNKYRNPNGKLPEFRKIVKGKIDYIKMIRGSDDPRYIKLYNKFIELEPEFGEQLELPTDIFNKFRDDDAFDYDIFLAYNSVDKRDALRLAENLTRNDINVWIDEWNVPPGRSFLDEIGDVFSNVRSVGAVIGKRGIGPWEKMEIKQAIIEFVRRKIPVIPILLPGVTKLPDDNNPIFLNQFRWVKFKSINDRGALRDLVWGIRHEPPRARKKLTALEKIDRFLSRIF